MNGISHMVNGLWCGSSLSGPLLWGALGTMRLVGILIWIGLGLLTLGLLLLVRSPWGRDKPLSKCIALSVLAHLLLMAFAYATRFVTDKAPPEPVFRVTAIETCSGDESEDRVMEGSEPKAWELSPETLAVPEPELDQIPQPAATVASESQPELTASTAPSTPLPPVTPRDVRLPSDEARALVEASDEETPEPVQPAAPDHGPAVAATSTPTSAAPGRRHETPAVGEWTELPAPPPQLVHTAPPVADRAAGSSGKTPWELVPLVPVAKDASPSTSPPPDDWREARPLPPDLLKRRLAELPPLARPGDARPVPRIYRLRLDADRRRWFLQLGGSLESLEALERGLAWLATHQSSDGRWDPDRYDAGREMHVLGHDRQGAGAQADSGMTGLALLALLGAGQTHYQGEHAAAVRKGLDYLRRTQRPDGCLAGDARLFAAMYCHSMAALALSEAYAMTGDPALREPVQRAVQYSLRAQGLQGGWRYRPGDPGDMSQFGWQVMLLSSAHEAGIGVPASERRRMRRFLDQCSTGPGLVLAAYQPGRPATPVMTAEAMVTRVFLDRIPPPSAMPPFRHMLQRDMPRDGRANLYYWYYGTLALHQLQDELWPEWSRALQRQLIQRQQTVGDHFGSWDPDTTWGSYGGRVYSTALATMTLEVYVRYLPLYAWRR